MQDDSVLDMVEVVARALWEKHRQDKLDAIRAGKMSASMSGIEYYDGGYENALESTKEYLRGEARAAIGALREPTEAMKEASYADRGCGCPCCINADNWSLMIDAALLPKGRGG